MKKRWKFFQLLMVGLGSLLLLLFMGSCSTRIIGGGFSGPEGRPASEDSIRKILSGGRLQPGNPDSHYLLGCYYQERGEHEKAIEEFKKTVLIDPGYAKAYNGMGISHDQLKEYRQAIDSYMLALYVDPSLDYAQSNLGYSFLLQGDIDKAILAFQKAIALNGREERFHNNLGLAYALKGQLDLAMAEFKQGGDEAKAHFNIARFYDQQGLTSIAKLHYSLAMRLDPSFTHARLASEAMAALSGIFQTDQEKAQKPGEAKISVENGLEKAGLSAPQIVGAQDFDPTTKDREAKGPSPSNNPQPLTGETQDSHEWVAGLPDPTPENHGGGPGVIVPSNSPSTPSRREATQGSPAKGKISEPANVGIEVSNGNGVDRMARRVGGYLKERGLPVKRYTNADHFQHKKTKIYYQDGCYEAAQHVAAQLPGSQKMERKGSWDRTNIQVKVLIGKDILSTEVAKGKERPS